MSLGVGDIIIDTACRVGQWDKDDDVVSQEDGAEDGQRRTRGTLLPEEHLFQVQRRPRQKNPFG